MMMGALRPDRPVTQQKLKPGTIRAVARYARPYWLPLLMFLLVTIIDAVIAVADPLLLRIIIDQGIIPRDEGVVIGVAAAVAAVAVFQAVVTFAIRWLAAWIGQSVIYDLRTQVFTHVQRQPIAFFTRAQTGSLVSRLNSDVIGAQQAITTVMASVVSNVLTVAAILVTMFYLSWVITLIAVVLIPAFIVPARTFGRRLQRLTRETMQLNAEVSAMMTERFNVAGALLVKLFGRPGEEAQAFAGRAARARDVQVKQATFGQVWFIALAMLASLASAVVYGAGGVLVLHRAFPLGTLVALAALLGTVYGPVMDLSGVQVSVMTALVSFDRVFEVLALEPLIADRPGARPLPRRMTVTGPDGGPDQRAGWRAG